MFFNGLNSNKLLQVSRDRALENARRRQIFSEICLKAIIRITFFLIFCLWLVEGQGDSVLRWGTEMVWSQAEGGIFQFWEALPILLLEWNPAWYFPLANNRGVYQVFVFPDQVK